jgi:hypothetical protein
MDGAKAIQLEKIKQFGVKLACKKGKEGEFSPALTVPASLTVMEELLVTVAWGSVCRPGYLQGHTAI